MEELYLEHQGVGKLDGAPGRGSGRYPLGSGENPNQHSAVSFLSRVDKLKSQGLSEKERADALGLSTTQLRAQISMAKNEERAAKVATAKRLAESGMGASEIGRKMGINESSVRSLLDVGSECKMNASQKTADFLKEIVDAKGMVDVGAGVEKELGNISTTKLNESLEILKAQGYEVYSRGLSQVTNPGQQTNLKVLCPPGTEYKDVYDTSKIHSVIDYDKILTDDGSKIRPAFQYPESLDSKRLKIRYAEEGGINKDGVIELRRGVDDISLGNSHYAQVRILVDGTHYLKGMAVYSDNLPDGCDVMFNTNKTKGTPMEKVLKPIKDDPKNPFGSTIKEHGGQSYYIDKKTGKEKLSLINKKSDEGDWNDWSDKLPSQFLAKQSKDLINKQLTLTLKDKIAEHEEISKLTNPTVKRKLLETFASDCDSAAVHLKAAALPRQKYQVILPLTTNKDSEIYAPNFRDGEKVALVRYPHGGTFEIPILTVNNKIREGKRVLGTSPKDAVGISSKVAERLSGADFDGDTVMVIPTNSKVKITSTNPLKGLKGFDPKTSYGADSYDSKGNPMRGGKTYKVMKDTQKQMGVVSNLITDMTLKGAKDDELARAVRHSMVVIDAAKHKLDYKSSEKENNIAELRRKYQGHYEDGKYKEGASTLLSRSKNEVSVLKRKGSPIINDDGSLSWKTTDKLTYTDKKTGKTVTRTQKSTQMAETKDARKLSSGTPQEEMYAKYANTLKGLANQSRKEMISTGSLKYSPSAKQTYRTEVDSLNAKLNLALKNAPRERQAQLIANSIMDAKKAEYPEMTKEERKKASQQALVDARARVGAKRNPIDITPKEWEAIQHGAISDSKLSQILNHTDVDKVRQYATPRSTNSMSTAKVAKASAMLASGYTRQEVADALGVSTSTITKYVNP